MFLLLALLAMMAVKAVTNWWRNRETDVPDAVGTDGERDSIADVARTIKSALESIDESPPSISVDAADRVVVVSVVAGHRAAIESLVVEALGEVECGAGNSWLVRGRGDHRLVAEVRVVSDMSGFARLGRA